MLGWSFAFIAFNLQIKGSYETAGKSRKCTVGKIKHASLDQADCFDRDFKVLFLVVMLSQSFFVSINKPYIISSSVGLTL